MNGPILQAQLLIPDSLFGQPYKSFLGDYVVTGIRKPFPCQNYTVDKP